jgi:excisionase family DNA binding protein
MNPSQILPNLLTIRELAEVLRIRESRAAEIVRRGEIESVRLGRQIRVSPAALERFIDGGGFKLPGGWRREA